MIDINVNSTSVEDGFLSVPTVNVEENVDDRPCEKSGLVKLGWHQRMKMENEKKDFQEEKTHLSSCHRYSHCERASF